MRSGFLENDVIMSIIFVRKEMFIDFERHGLSKQLIFSQKGN